ncbi:MAG: hypothetical protein KDI19_16160 [Pseudomonadales bacterium]|nr:hypothetical protein [Pseudomonadales bacterium]
MSELDDAIKGVESENRVLSEHLREQSSGNAKRVPIRLLAGVVVLVFGLHQLYSLRTWMFGVSEETVQGDITSLLERTDDSLRRARQETGDYPQRLPPTVPAWLVSYMPSTEGYTLSASVDGVVVELRRAGDRVTIERR